MAWPRRKPLAGSPRVEFVWPAANLKNSDIYCGCVWVNPYYHKNPIHKNSIPNCIKFNCHNRNIIQYIAEPKMSLYAESYSQALLDAEVKYKKLHNLFLLAGLRKKIQCYKVHSAQPDRYYDCFYETESRMLQQSQEFKTNCEQIDVMDLLCRMSTKSVWRTARRTLNKEGRKNKNVLRSVGKLSQDPCSSCMRIFIKQQWEKSLSIRKPRNIDPLTDYFTFI